MFRSNKTLSTANEIIDAYLSSEESHKKVGSVVISKKDGRKTVAVGRLYFKDRVLYAAHIEDREIPIGKRVIAGGKVRSDELESIFSRTGGMTSPRIIDLLLDGQLIPEQTISNYVKEHFLDNLSIILSWDDCTGESYINDTTKDFALPYHVGIDRVREILKTRQELKKKFQDEISDSVHPSEINSLTFSLMRKPNGNFGNEIMLILSLCDRNHTFAAISEETGIPQFNIFQTLYQLWQREMVEINLGGIRLPYSSTLAKKPEIFDAYREPEKREINLPVVREEEYLQEKENAQAATDETADQPENDEENDDVSDSAAEAHKEADVPSSEHEDDEFITYDDEAEQDADSDEAEQETVLAESEADTGSSFITTTASEKEPASAEEFISVEEAEETSEFEPEEEPASDKNDDSYGGHNIEISELEELHHLGQEMRERIERDTAAIQEEAEEQEHEFLHEADIDEAETDEAEPHATNLSDDDRKPSMSKIREMAKKLGELEQHLIALENTLETARNTRISDEAAFVEAKAAFEATKLNLEESKQVELEAQNKYNETCVKIEDLMKTFNL